uniref:Uncharacterized protein n=1 Tax=Rhizophora mucronata TaxID=61149 RepID=A0A2P2IPI8_RHIMU
MVAPSLWFVSFGFSPNFDAVWLKFFFFFKRLL